jgi:hypothetical protein
MIFEEPTKEPTDIFEGVEPPASAERPMGFGQASRPVLRAVGPGGAAMPPMAPRRGGLGKIFTILLIIILLAGVGGAIFYFAYWLPGQKAAEPAPAAEEQTPAVTEEEAPVAEEETPTPAAPEAATSTEEIPAVTQPASTLDTDGDGLTNEEEAALGTDPASADTDGDGLSDREEVNIWHTNPLSPDTDGDGFTDKTEIDNGFNPNGEGKLPTFPGV